MKLVVTVMVRDEIDIVAAMVEHHLAQGADLIIATDNGSVDGTAEVLQRYADLGVLELHHDPVLRKQQHAVVTGMARRACTEHQADWVINADADEFWVAQNPRLTLREAFARIDPGLGSFVVPVHDMIGAPAAEGTGLQRLVYRDDRPVERMREVGVHAHATPDSVHVADPEVVVSQGNHFVNIPSKGRPDPEWAIEVLHFPWRSWAQFSGKVERAGYTLVPLDLHYKGGRVKCEIGLAKGKKQYDKRETEREREWQRERQRLVKQVSKA